MLPVYRSGGKIADDTRISAPNSHAFRRASGRRTLFRVTEQLEPRFLLLRRRHRKLLDRLRLYQPFPVGLEDRRNKRRDSKAQ